MGKQVLLGTEISAYSLSVLRDWGVTHAVLCCDRPEPLSGHEFEYLLAPQHAELELKADITCTFVRSACLEGAHGRVLALCALLRVDSARQASVNAI
jgi:hypothetical protein